MMLHELLTQMKTLEGPDFYSKRVDDQIVKNLNPKFELREYQYEAFGRFEYKLETHFKQNKSQPLNVLYHMATGSGKTLVMAGEILTLYKRGYRNFLFFVNSANIIKKTKENFLNKASSKYLFNDVISIDGVNVNIREVDNFSATNHDDINIVFTTIQNLHITMSQPKENALSLDDFEDHKVVLISDEAHHINVETKKKKNNDELISYTSWESTVKSIYEANTSNIMLEFTATAELTDPAIEAKYKDIVLFDYPLKEFRLDGYSKEVKVVQIDSEPMNRALQALIVSQYRRKIFEKHKLLIKPVILFKSQRIAESQLFHKEFIDVIENITGKVLEDIKASVDTTGIVSKAFNYFDKHNISLEAVALELQGDFGIENTIEVNSKDSVESQQILLNSLEDSDNEIRAVFAVDKLNEGWDVLNLFDIVRLYDVRSPKETTKEAQLIGRGARYCPFKINDEQPLYQRKYDILDDTEEEHELKVCEELYYYSAHNPKYIQELNKALQKIGIAPTLSKELPLKLKESFKQTDFYKNGFIYTNKRLANDRADVIGLDSSLIKTSYSYTVQTGASSELTVFDTTTSRQIDLKTKSFEIKSFGKHVVRKAMASIPEMAFDKLIQHFPNLTSIEQFIEDDNYLGKVKVRVSAKADALQSLTQIEKLGATKSVLTTIAEKLDKDKIDYKGSIEFEVDFVHNVFGDKILNIVNDGNSKQEFGVPQSAPLSQHLQLDLSSRDWFAFNENYGTSEEKYLVKYIDEMIEDLQRKYDEVYLVRNERHFRIYSFDDGKPFEPDFVLFLKRQEMQTSLTYQVFIEPKGDHLLEQDEWKQAFLLQLKDRHQIDQVWQGKHFTLWGLPFYNNNLAQTEFEPAFEELLK
ncbi:DEAD/DEAH box helicase family protein [Vibrio sp. OPT18]|uniref:DEAD/DEAH box helicase family protein n=1 Tax=Vibrio sp. OPT18 TaxID=2778641 RepID=UPI0018800D12|nr:DEAD/DEAH box helicase family protein [Vibrio sp. OPT18]MBE8577871.1 DEAD/DEAH box helicase family protein [Vibrio sp. OPT18]